MILAALALASGAGAALLHTCAASPLPAAPPFAGPLPPASPPPGTAIFGLLTGVVHRRASDAYRGGSFLERRDSAIAAVLVRHPRGDLLVDTGFGSRIDAQFALMPAAFRAVTTYERRATAAEQLRAGGYDLGRLRGVLLTHAHWDHASALGDFPDVPVLVTPEERRFVDSGGARTVIARATPGVRWETYTFESGPYLGHPSSHDVHGDGSIVVVPAPGHTPGSVLVFVALPDGKRYALLGDLAWQREGVLQREERPWVWREAVDDDEVAVRRELVLVASLATAFPGLALVPAHDARAIAELPPWPPR